jgi:hypothetical protein
LMISFVFISSQWLMAGDSVVLVSDRNVESAVIRNILRRPGSFVR